MVLSRHTGRMRETFPVLIGTLVSQTALNIVALVMLGGIIVSTTDLFQASTHKLFLVSTAPLLVLLAVLRQGDEAYGVPIAHAIEQLDRLLGLDLDRDPQRLRDLDAPGAVRTRVSRCRRVPRR